MADSPEPQSNQQSSHAIVVDDLTRTFTTGTRKKRTTIEAVNEISFTVERGERLAFIGPNGAGKSTSIKMLTGILHPTNGSATVLGLVPWKQRQALARRIGTLFGQRSQLWQELAPRASLEMLGAIFDLSDAEANRRIGELGELLDAADLFDQPARSLSLGQRMRCELSACMLHSPELLFLDEPTIGLDLLAKQLFRQLLVRLNAEVGTTVFLTSHDVADIEYVADRAIVVNHGTIIHDTPVHAMRRSLLSRKRVEIGLVPQAEILSAAEVLSAVEVPSAHEELLGAFEAVAGQGVTVAMATPTMIHLDVDTTAQPIRDVLDRILSIFPVADLSVVDPPLDQVIGEIYQRPAS